MLDFVHCNVHCYPKSFPEVAYNHWSIFIWNMEPLSAIPVPKNTLITSKMVQVY